MPALFRHAMPNGKTLSSFGLFLCLGLSTAILGPALPSLGRQTGVSLAGMGLLFLVGSTGYTLGTMAGGALFGRLRVRRTLGVAQLVAAACIAVTPTVGSLSLLLTIVFCRGVAEGIVNTGANTLLLWTHGDKATPFVNATHFCFGVGCFVAPLFVAGFSGRADGYREAFWIVASFATLVGWAILWDSRREPPMRIRHRPGDRREPRSMPCGPILCSALFLFAYVGAEISFGGWLSSYALALGGISAEGAAYLTSAFWFAFTIGRLASIGIALRSTPRRVIPVALTICMGLCLLLFVVRSSGWLLWSVCVGLGLFMAPLWPNGFALAGEIIPMTALASALVLLGDSLGTILLPALAGRWIEVVGPTRLSFSLPLLVFGSLLGSLVTFWLLVQYAAYPRRSPPADG